MCVPIRVRTEINQAIAAAATVLQHLEQDCEYKLAAIRTAGAHLQSSDISMSMIAIRKRRRPAFDKKQIHV